MDSRSPIAAKPGNPEKYDYEYKRKGTCNIFVAVVPKAGKRIVKVTDTRTKADFACFVEELLNNHFPKADYIQLVVDNLNTHFERSFYETMGHQKSFPDTEANKIYLHPETCKLAEYGRN